LVADGTSNISGGLSKLYNGWNNYLDESDKAGDYNFMRKGYKKVSKKLTGREDIGEKSI